MSGARASRYGAILWLEKADIDDAIRYAKAFDDPVTACERVAPACRSGERWAVVDLSTMGVVASGPSPATWEDLPT